MGRKQTSRRGQENGGGAEWLLVLITDKLNFFVQCLEETAIYIFHRQGDPIIASILTTTQATVAAKSSTPTVMPARS